MNPLHHPILQVGMVFETDAQEVTKSSAVDFATQFDPQPMHLDSASGAAGPFGGLTASGWHTLSLTMRLMALRQPFGGTPLLGVGVDNISFLSPVFPGIRLYVWSKIIRMRPTRKPERSLVTLELETRNRETEEILIRQNWTLMVPTHQTNLETDPTG